MKQIFGYFLLISIISICWGSSLLFFSQNDLTGVAVTFGIGSIFAALLVYAVSYELRKRRRLKFIEENFEVIMTELDYINALSDSLYYVHTKWTDPDGAAEYFFKSEYVEFNPEIFLKNKQIPVKISRKNYKLYVVDLSILPKLA